ncbi:sugar ABC transporter ATP-binding protein [Arthrobacter sp. I2-34]|uniref:Sugar ABC transporter ATP-binding protein n=1 Tax=Arthrobacter hankyongi TaxID=2904801 RepID=A0ABS9LCM6_9MICC|nr:sugar ABC transporter ATP-binding protein [Arthrobacter hankyongi]MCG2624425.1 sugar ABC transporter ATP-binding protein [Arthrobacter hankyongi]
MDTASGAELSASGQELRPAGDPAVDPDSRPGMVPFVSLRGISKQFPGVNALTDVDLDLYGGECHAVLGENGAGKSTLLKVIAGVHAPDTGTLLLAGEERALKSPADARRRGISMVPQELSFAGDRSVAENIFLGSLPRRGPFVRQRSLLRQAETILARLGVDIDPGSQMRTHPPAVQQMVMIARGMAMEGRLFILDEPTAALTDPEIERLFDVMEALKADGAALLYVSHRLPELARIADTITILRDGRVVDRVPARDTSEQQLVRSMVGRTIERFFDTKSQHEVDRSVSLSVEGLTNTSFSDISFGVHSGEIVGLAGLMGAGRTEVARGIFGIDKVSAGTVKIQGKAVSIKSPRDAIAAGLALVPEERKAQGLILDFSISDNIVLPFLRRLSRGRVISTRRLKAYASRASEEVGVKATGVGVPVGQLSGGNQQKVILARWLAAKPQVYILDEPTRGIDVGAKADIYRQIGALTDAGAAVLVISSELPELLGICDRILVMRAGRLVGEVQSATATEESILQLAMGSQES